MSASFTTTTGKSKISNFSASSTPLSPLAQMVAHRSDTSSSRSTRACSNLTDLKERAMCWTRRAKRAMPCLCLLELPPRPSEGAQGIVGLPFNVGAHHGDGCESAL